MRHIFPFFALFPTLLMAAEVIPPKPPKYFNDYANVVSPATSAELNQQLAQFERDRASQIVVVVYPTMQTDSSIEDYTVRVAQSWGVGQKEKNNGAVLFVFVQDHKMYIQVGYRLEGALPDALAKQIIENEIKPYFRNGDFDSGLRRGVAAILQATKGEYQGTGRTVADRSGANHSRLPVSPIVVFILFMVIMAVIRTIILSSGDMVYTAGGRTTSYGGFGGMSIGGGFSSGGGSSGDSGFSGGGGSFGGGGAGGSW